jgi:uncharacterized protein
MVPISRPPAARAMTPRRTLVVMVKEPRAGRVKTRLARGIGAAAATAFYRHTTRAVLVRVTRPDEWTTVLAIAPDNALQTRMLAHNGPRQPQGSGDLGARMQRIFGRAPSGPVLIIGSDVPGITATHVRQAFAALGANDAVFGPAPDGGYWLIGLKRFPGVPRAFANVRWSTAHALADTRANLERLRIALLEPLDDIDEAGDLRRFPFSPGRLVLPCPRG